jgi:hypothetical protein
VPSKEGPRLIPNLNPLGDSHLLSLQGRVQIHLLARE